MRFKMSQTQQSSARAWVSVIATALFFFYWFIQLSLNNTLHDFYVAKFHIESYGLFTSMYLIGNVIMFIPAGMILDKFSTKKVLCINVGIMILGALGLLFAHNTFLAYVCMLVVGCAGAFSLLASLRIATTLFSANKAGFPISVAITLGMCGGLFGNSIGKILYDYFGSGANVQMVNIALGVVILVLIILGVKEAPKSVTENHTDGQTLSIFQALATVAKNPQNWLAGLYVSLLNLPIMILDFAFGQDYLKTVFHIEPLQAANTASMIFIGFMVAGPFVGKWSDSWGYRKPLMILGATASLGVMLLLYIPGLSYVWLMVIFFAIGVVTSAQNIGYPVIAESNDPTLTATANALGSILIMGGGAIAQNIFGSLQSTSGYSVAYHMLPICMVIALLIALAIKETGWKKKETAGA